VSGYLLVIFLLLLGSALSTIGDLVGTKIGKARISIFNLRPRNSAILITILTGGFISATSLLSIILVDRQLRVGLFRLDNLQRKLQESKLALIPLKEEKKKLENKIQISEKELKKLEKDLIALRRGNVAIRTNQILFRAVIDSTNSNDINNQLRQIIQSANVITHRLIKPKSKSIKPILFVRKNHISELKKVLLNEGEWILIIRSGANVLQGENHVYAFPEVIENKQILYKGQIISQTTINREEIQNDQVQNKIDLLISSTLAEIRRRGSLANDFKLSTKTLSRLKKKFNKNYSNSYILQMISLEDTKTINDISVDIEVIPQ
tara:strand:- start:858 stop:1823 length:966 start_codon:yes stop_codon:yes gene_type:complete